MSIIKNDFPSHYRALIADLQQKHGDLEVKVYEEILANIALRQERDELWEHVRGLEITVNQLTDEIEQLKKAS